MFSLKRVITPEANQYEFQTRIKIAFSVERRGSASVRVTSSCMVFPVCNTPRTLCFVGNLKAPKVKVCDLTAPACGQPSNIAVPQTPLNCV